MNRCPTCNKQTFISPNNRVFTVEDTEEYTSYVVCSNEKCSVNKEGDEENGRKV